MDGNIRLFKDPSRNVSPVFAILVILIIGIFFVLIIWIKSEDIITESMLFDSTSKIIGNSQLYKKMNKVEMGQAGVAEALTGDTETAYIRGILENKDGQFISVDPIEMITGQAALIAKIQDRQCKIPGESSASLIQEVNKTGMDKLPEKFMACLPVDYYIRNTSTSEMKLEVSPLALIYRTMVFKEGTTDLAKISFEELKNNFKSDIFHYSDLPFKLTLKDGIVMKMEQEYLP